MTFGDQPRVSVIVPVRDRADLLPKALEALAAQTYRDFEVIVIDDGSTDRSRDLAFAHAASHPNVRVVSTGGAGAVAARCAGISDALGTILAFTDSDCMPDAEWLSAGVAAIDKGADAVQGVTVSERPLQPLERSISHGGSERLFATCNMFYRREAYEQAGGFDRAAEKRWRFRGPASGRALGFGEDTLLGWTVARRGHVVVAPGAIVHHAVISPGARELFWRSWMAGGFPALIREIPELRGTLLKQGVFLGTRRVPLYAFLAAVPVSLLTHRREVAIAGGLWWVIARARMLLRRPGPVSRRLSAVPVEMTIDVITAAALLWGSARYRSIVV